MPAFPYGDGVSAFAAFTMPRLRYRGLGKAGGGWKRANSSTVPRLVRTPLRQRAKHDEAWAQIAALFGNDPVTIEGARLTLGKCHPKRRQK